MLRRAYRIVSPRHEATAWTGEGARRFGGRWNSPGRPVVYAADTLSLAALERLVHLEDHEVVGRHRWAWIEYDAKQMTTLADDDLPASWRDDPAPPETQRVGDRWLAAGRPLVLRVPSVLVPGEYNVMFNPADPRFDALTRSPFDRFVFDARLAR